ncbi:hypothetical protein FKO01_11100 [Mesorhizobium sp. B2-3-3]|nr:hypothetical protein FKO01_11100 [Mesorhizobium sp. B2-3-3]
MKKSILGARFGIALVVTIPVLEANAAATAVIDQRWPGCRGKRPPQRSTRNTGGKAATGTY